MNPQTNSYTNQPQSTSGGSSLRLGRILLVLLLSLAIIAGGTFAYLKLNNQNKSLKQQNTELNTKIQNLETKLNQAEESQNNSKESSNQQSYLEIKEWGVKLNFTRADQVTYQLTNDGSSQTAEFKIKETGIDTSSCINGTKDLGISLIRSSSKLELPSPTSLAIPKSRILTI
jgi:uncharacterized protein HemX